MPKNIKLGTETVLNVSTLKCEDADTGEYDNFIDTTDATATASQVEVGATCYVNGVKITGTGSPLDPAAFYTLINNSKYGG